VLHLQTLMFNQAKTATKKAGWHRPPGQLSPAEETAAAAEAAAALRADIGAALQAAAAQRAQASQDAAASSAKRTLAPSAPTRPPPDIQVLRPSDAEYGTAAALAPRPGFTRLKRVRVASREARFDAFKRGAGGKVCGVQLRPGEALQEVDVYHGTPACSNAVGIARRGPDLSNVASGRVYGHGFYSALTSDKSTPSSYAGGQGSVCVCRAAYVRCLQLGPGNHTLASLQSQSPDQNVIEAAGSPTWRVWFHPDAFVVRYIIDYGPEARRPPGCSSCAPFRASPLAGSRTDDARGGGGGARRGRCGRFADSQIRRAAAADM